MGTRVAIQAQGFRCGVWGVGCGVWSVKCGVWGVGCGVWSFGCGVRGVGVGIGRYGFMAEGSNRHRTLGFPRAIGMYGVMDGSGLWVEGGD